MPRGTKGMGRPASQGRNEEAQAMREARVPRDAESPYEMSEEQLERISEVLDDLQDVIDAGGITLDEQMVDHLGQVSENLQSLIDAGGTELPGRAERTLTRMESLLNRISDMEDGDNTEHAANALSRIDEKLEKILEDHSEILTDEFTALLDTASVTLDTVLEDDAYDITSEADLVQKAANALTAALDEDLVKISDEGLINVQALIDDIATAVDTGFFALDEDQLTTLSDSHTHVSTEISDGIIDDVEAYFDAVAEGREVFHDIGLGHGHWRPNDETVETVGTTETETFDVFTA